MHTHTLRPIGSRTKGIHGTANATHFIHKGEKIPLNSDRWDVREIEEPVHKWFISAFVVVVFVVAIGLVGHFEQKQLQLGHEIRTDVP